MRVFEDVEGNVWELLPIGLFACRESSYPYPVTLHYLTSEFGPLKELESA